MRIEVVNGYVCRNCTDVELARKGVDPAHPKDGPNGAHKVDDDRGPAVTFGGAIAEPASPSVQVQPAAYLPGAIADLKA